MKKNQSTQRGKNQFDYKIRLYANKQWLEKKYLEEKLSTHKIAKLVGVAGGTTIHKWLKRFNIPTRSGIGASREANVRWKGGSFISKSTGYKYVLTNCEHQYGTLRKGKYCRYMPEQNLVMEKALGRHIKNGELIHHKNGIKLDNQIENLELLESNSQHQKLEARISHFAKQLIWGNIYPTLKNELQRKFKEFQEK